MTYKGSTEARQNSGAPGYIKGLKLKTGTLSTASMTGIEAAKAKPYIYEPVDGFKLRGANNQGECYKLKKTLTTPVIDISKVKNSDGTPKFNPDLDMKDSKD